MCDAIIQQHWRLVEYTLHVYGVALWSMWLRYSLAHWTRAWLPCTSRYHLKQTPQPHISSRD